MKKFSTILFFTTILIFGSLFCSNAHSFEAVDVDPQASWANVNRVDLGQFDSGVLELKVGQSLTVSGNASFSGDQAAIDQAQVSFEDIDPALSISYDGNFVINGNTGSFTFTVTLISNENRPHTFKLVVADSDINDDNHLTPYSDTQTVIAIEDPDSSSSESSSSESSSSESSSSESSSSESSASKSSSSESSSSESSSSESSSSESSSFESSSSESSSFESSSSEPNSTSYSASTSATSNSNYTRLPKAGESRHFLLTVLGAALLLLSVLLIRKNYSQKL